MWEMLRLDFDYFIYKRVIGNKFVNYLSLIFFIYKIRMRSYLLWVVLEN